MRTVFASSITQVRVRKKKEGRTSTYRRLYWKKAKSRVMVRAALRMTARIVPGEAGSGREENRALLAEQMITRGGAALGRRQRSLYR
jgi:hypothetical protein